MPEIKRVFQIRPHFFQISYRNIYIGHYQKGCWAAKFLLLLGGLIMKSKLLSLILALSLLITSAACVYASNGGTKEHGNKAALTTTETDQSAVTEKIKNEAKKEAIVQKKEQIRAQYTEQEMDAVNDAAEKIKKADPGAKVLGFDSVISDDAKFKFDTPPVIKGGRTLVPVRAITEGFGADLVYDKETQVVTITKGDTVIELTLGSMTAVVNGEEVQMDTKANVVNNRTYVPLRFVLETFKLSVEWDEDTETVEIGDGTTETTDGAIETTDGAIETTDGAIDVPEGTTTDETDTSTTDSAITVTE